MLEADRLSFTHPGASRHYEFSFTALPGEITAVSGQSGAGKSTLLDLIAGFLTPSERHPRPSMAGTSCPLPPEQRPVSILFQSETLFDHLSAARNLALGLPRNTAPHRRTRPHRRRPCRSRAARHRGPARRNPVGRRKAARRPRPHPAPQPAGPAARRTLLGPRRQHPLHHARTGARASPSATDGSPCWSATTSTTSRPSPPAATASRTALHRLARKSKGPGRCRGLQTPG